MTNFKQLSKNDHDDDDGNNNNFKIDVTINEHHR